MSMMWTPSGVVGGTLSRVSIPSKHMGAFRDFAAFARHYGLGMHCARCGKDLVGKNADTDNLQAVVCGCREFIAPNNERQILQ